MNIKASWKYAILTAGIGLSAIVGFTVPWIKTKPECLASENQTVIRWKDMYYRSCRRSWRGICLWPIRRPHSTYKVTVKDGTPLRNEEGRPIAIAGGKIKAWTVYDSIAWNQIADRPRLKARFPDYELIAVNEYVVVVETRFRLFHHVEATLRICTAKPRS